ncbi:MAG: lysophospholipid acyltransferase family protein [Alphaproteobacteria bacterium]
MISLGRFWANGVVFFLKHIAKIKIEIKGEIPKTPALFALNHQSALETIVFQTIIKNPVFILKKELFYLPIFGLGLKKIGHIGINRKMGRQAIFTIKRKTKELFEKGFSMAIFPEGTRCPVGKLGRIGSGIFIMQEATESKIYPVKIKTGHVWGKNSFIKKSGIATFEFKKPIKYKKNSRSALTKKLKDSFSS